MIDTDRMVLEQAIKALHQMIDDIVSDCTDTEFGGWKAPSKKIMMQAKASLPEGYQNSFNKKAHKISREAMEVILKSNPIPIITPASLKKCL